MFGQSRAVVGLDIGSSAVKAVELKAAGKAHRVAAFGMEPVPPGAIVDGAIVDARAVSDAIRRLFESETAFTAEGVCASLSGHAVIVKRITLPVMTQSDLDKSIDWEVEQCMPFDLQDLNVDYQVLDSGTGPESRGSMDVLLVAAKKERVRDYADVIAEAGLTPVMFDVDALALQNAYEANEGFEPGQVVVLLNAGASAVNISILQGDQSVFTRDIPMGGDTYTGAVQQALDLPRDAAEQLKKGTLANGATFEQVRPVLRAVTGSVLLEIRKTFDYLEATAFSDRIDRIVLSGGASRVDGFREMLQDRFDTPVADFDPFRAVTWSARRPDAGLAEAASTAAVAVGLALRRVGDR